MFTILFEILNYHLHSDWKRMQCSYKTVKKHIYFRRFSNTDRQFFKLIFNIAFAYYHEIVSSEIFLKSMDVRHSCMRYDKVQFRKL